MTWFFFALTGALCTALHQICQKLAADRGANNFHVSLFFLLGPSLIIPFLAATRGVDWLFSHGWGNPHFWLYCGINCVCGYFTVRFSVEANRLRDATLIASTTGINTLAITIPPLFLLGEHMAPAGWVAIALIIAGSVLSGCSMGDKSSKRAVDNKRGMMYFLASVPFYAFLPTLIKLMIVDCGAAPAVTAGTPSLILCAGMLCGSGSGPPSSVKTPWITLSIIAILALASGLLTNTAMGLTSVGNAMAIKRLSPLFLFLFGAVFFKEREDILLRLAALALMLGGGVVMYIWG